MRILMLPRYTRQGANSRYRLWQYLPMFEDAGHRVEVRPMLDDSYLHSLYKKGIRPLRAVVAGYFRQLVSLILVRRYDAVLLDQELVPYLPPIFEEFACKLNRRLVVDYDDAAYFKYEHRWPLQGKIPGIMRSARAVVVGNRHLQRYASQYSNDIRLIPTVVDISKYQVNLHSESSEVVRICWIGTPVTASEYLPSMFPVFRELKKRHLNLRFRFIGAGQIAGTDDLPIEVVAWSEEDEANAISSCDIGIMPLPDAEFQRGKCGLKLIQYMAAGLPVVASPVGENSIIVAHGENGLYANTNEEWLEHLSRLINDRELRQRMGRAGRAKAKQNYSLTYGFQEWSRLMQDIMV